MIVIGRARQCDCEGLISRMCVAFMKGSFFVSTRMFIKVHLKF